MGKKQLDFSETEKFLEGFPAEDMKMMVLDSGLRVAEIDLKDQNQVKDINEIAGTLRLCYQMLCTIKNGSE